MERSAKTLASTLFLSFLLLLALETEAAEITVPASGINPRPLCASQYALANYACSMIPFSPLTPPSPSTPTLDAHHGRRKHGQHHHHHHNHRHSGTKEQDDCCRWLNGIDTDCVCEMLVRLPDFLSRPVHEYSLIVGDTCTVTYSCGGRVIRK